MSPPPGGGLPVGRPPAGDIGEVGALLDQLQDVLRRFQVRDHDVRRLDGAVVTFLPDVAGHLVGADGDGEGAGLEGAHEPVPPQASHAAHVEGAVLDALLLRLQQQQLPVDEGLQVLLHPVRRSGLARLPGQAGLEVAHVPGGDRLVSHHRHRHRPALFPRTAAPQDGRRPQNAQRPRHPGTTPADLHSSLLFSLPIADRRTRWRRPPCRTRSRRRSPAASAADPAWCAACTPGRRARSSTAPPPRPR